MAKITNEMVQECYKQAREVYFERTNETDAIENVSKKTGMVKGSIQDYIKVYIAMRNGNMYKRTVNEYATKYYLENIFYDDGFESLQVALQALFLHIEYYKKSQNSDGEGLQKIYDDFLKMQREDCSRFHLYNEFHEWLKKCPDLHNSSPSNYMTWLRFIHYYYNIKKTLNIEDIEKIIAKENINRLDRDKYNKPKDIKNFKSALNKYLEFLNYMKNLDFEKYNKQLESSRFHIGFFGHVLMKMIDLYEDGNLTAENVKKMLSLQIEMANRGDSYASYRLAYWNEVGIGVPQNKTLALEWYKKSAEQGYSRAQDYLAVCYERGWGVEQNYKIAFKWYMKAAQQGLSTAQFKVSEFYKRGLGVDKDYLGENGWLKEAADHGNIQAQLEVGFKYISSASSKLGIPLPQDIVEVITQRDAIPSLATEEEIEQLGEETIGRLMKVVDDPAKVTEILENLNIEGFEKAMVKSGEKEFYNVKAYTVNCLQAYDPIEEDYYTVDVEDFGPITDENERIEHISLFMTDNYQKVEEYLRKKNKLYYAPTARDFYDSKNIARGIYLEMEKHECNFAVNISKYSLITVYFHDGNLSKTAVINFQIPTTYTDAADINIDYTAITKVLEEIRKNVGDDEYIK